MLFPASFLGCLYIGRFLYICLSRFIAGVLSAFLCFLVVLYRVGCICSYTALYELIRALYIISCNSIYSDYCMSIYTITPWEAHISPLSASFMYIVSIYQLYIHRPLYAIYVRYMSISIPFSMYIHDHIYTMCFICIYRGSFILLEFILFFTLCFILCMYILFFFFYSMYI